MKKASLLAAAATVLVGCSAHPSASSPPPPSPTARTTTPSPADGGGPSSDLTRPLHLPPTVGKRCPTTSGHYVATPEFGSMALGSGVVRVGIAAVGRPKPGFHPARFQGWLALKTHFFSYPRYRGPILVRAGRIGGRGEIRIGATPTEAGPLFIPAGSGWREHPYFTFVTTSGCYGWQIDGSTFSYVVVVRILEPRS